MDRMAGVIIKHQKQTMISQNQMAAKAIKMTQISRMMVSKIMITREEEAKAAARTMEMANRNRIRQQQPL